MVTNRRLNLWSRLQTDFDVVPFSFGEGVAELASEDGSQKSEVRGQKSEVRGQKAEDGGRRTEDGRKTELAWVGRLQADSPVTALGDALREVLRRKRGQPLAGIVLMTDGVSNSGTQPRDALPMLQGERVPVYAYGVGVTSPRDVIVENLFAWWSSFKMSYDFRACSFAWTGRRGEVVLKLAGETVAHSYGELSGNGGQSVPIHSRPPKKAV